MWSAYGSGLASPPKSGTAVPRFVAARGVDGRAPHGADGKKACAQGGHGSSHAAWPDGRRREGSVKENQAEEEASVSAALPGTANRQPHTDNTRRMIREPPRRDGENKNLGDTVKQPSLSSRLGLASRALAAWQIDTPGRFARTSDIVDWYWSPRLKSSEFTARCPPNMPQGAGKAPRELKRLGGFGGARKAGHRQRGHAPRHCTPRVDRAGSGSGARVPLCSRRGGRERAAPLARRAACSAARSSRA